MLISINFPAILIFKRTGFPQQQPLLPVPLAQIAFRLKNGCIDQVCFYAGSPTFPVTAANFPASDSEPLEDIQIFFLRYLKPNRFRF